MKPLLFLTIFIATCSSINSCRRETKDHERCGCDDIKTITNPAKQDTITLYAPKSFTPNNDGLNDYFIPVYSQKTDMIFFRFEVYNRRRNKTYFSTNNANTRGWNGTNKQTELLGTDIYAWMLSGTTITGADVKWIGEVLLYRKCYERIGFNRCSFGDMIIPNQGFVIPTNELNCK